jgi:predicted AlkP superfamily pyrophosphatase or phosphodiesterase
VLISVDGLRPDDYLPRPGRLARTPAIDALRTQGSWAEAVVPQYPSQTYPCHTSIVTGVAPARHGIVQNTWLDPVSSVERWHFESSALKVRPIWDAAAAAGLKTAAVSWPVTVGARLDYLVPETNQAPPDSTWLDLARRQSTPGLVDAVVTRLGGFGAKDNLQYDKRDRFAAAAAALILEKYRPNLLLLHLVDTDGAQHTFGPNSTEALEAISRVDARIADIVAAAGKAGIASETAFIVTGDHGFARVHSAFQPNAVLRDAGLFSTDASGRIVSWRAIAHRSTIRLKDPSDHALATRVEALFDDLARNRYRGLFRVVGRNEIASLGGDPDALLVIEPSEGYTTAAGVDGGFLVPTDRRGDHGYLPTSAPMLTGLIVSGAGIRDGIALPLTRQIDIAPTVARLLGFELPDADGVPIVGVLSDRATARSNRRK